MLGSKLSRRSRRDFVAAVYELWYLHGTKDRGVVYTQNQDPHGPSIVWLSGDSDLGSAECEHALLLESTVLQFWLRASDVGCTARRCELSLGHRSIPECMVLGSSMC